MKSLRVITAPPQYPVSLAEAKAHCLVDITTDDNLITGYIAAATAWAEESCQRKFCTQLVELTLDEFPACALELPGGHVQSLVSITYRDSDDALQTWDSAQYITDLSAEPARVEAAQTYVYPYARSRVGAVKARYWVGYEPGGTSPTDYAANVPGPIKQAILMLVGHWYENRSSVEIGQLQALSVPMATEQLLWPYRML